jgi:beta-galactosidase
MGSRRTARVVNRDGMPVLEIDGKPTPPHIFFFNTEVDSGRRFLEPQVRLAAAAGVHLYSFCLPWPWEDPNTEPDYAVGEGYMDAFVAADPEALFIPRIRCEGPDAWLEAHPEAKVKYADGTRPMMSSMASGLWWETLGTGLRRALRHFENGPHGDRIIAYHPAGQNSNEWFHHEYWLHGPDHGEANQAGFRKWLEAKYATPDDLARAWGQPGMKFADARVPAAPAPAPEGAPFAAFCAASEEQDRLDFQEYTNLLVADRVCGIARIIKEATDRRKAVVLFYGYLQEMHGPESGHFALDPVLRSPDVDILSSPLSYMDRQSGGCGGFMTAVDSVAAHGKLWVVENDYRTHSINVAELPEWITEEGLGPRSPDLPRTLGVIRREHGAMLAHRCGTWWMDLIAAGAYGDPAVWEEIGGTLAPLWEERAARPTPFRPDAAVIIDEASLRTLRCPPGAGMACYSPVYDHLLRKARAAFARAGADVGWYSLADFIEGLVPACRVLWFPCCFLADHVEAIRARLAGTGTTAVWQCAPGYLGGEAAMRRLTGINLRAGHGPAASLGEGLLEGLAWDGEFSLDPRVEAVPGACTVLARHTEGGGISAALKPDDGLTSVFLGGIDPGPGVIARLLDKAGVHRWTRDGGIAYADDKFLFVHHGEAGNHEICLPPGIAAEEVGGRQEPRHGSFTQPFDAGQTRIFRLKKT